MSFKGFSIFSSGHHFVQPSGAILVILVEGIGGTLLCKYFEIRPLAKDEMSFEDFLFFSSGGHLGFSMDIILPCFDPEVILLLKSKFMLKVI